MKNQGYLLAFIANNGYDADVYYECGCTEYKTILANFTAQEVRDCTNCAVSWQEYTEYCHNESLYSTL